MTDPKTSDPPRFQQLSADESQVNEVHANEFPSGNSEMSREHRKFLFDCDQLIDLCSSIQQLEVMDQSDTILEVRLQDLDKFYEKIQGSYENLLFSSPSANTRDYKEQGKININVCSEAYYVARSCLLDMLKCSQEYNGPSPLIRRNPPLQIPQITQPQNESYLKVPACDTDVFSGGYEEWPSFRDMFTAVYINHPKLTRVQRLYHLRNKTKGDAGQIVKRYTLCEDNFELAWEALKSRYENKRVLVDKQLKILFNIPTATVENSESLQKIQATVNDCLSTFKTLNVKVADWDPILIYLISTKLPDTTLALWEQSLKSHRELPNWCQMDEFLINRYEVVERISSIRSIRDQQVPSATYPIKTQTYSSQENLRPMCIICESNHNLRTCPAFRRFTVQERIDFVFKNKICNNCLSHGHMKNNCKSKNTCMHCKKKHHSLLHLTTQDNSIESAAGQRFASEQPESSSNSRTIPKSQRDNANAQVQATFSASNETILLRTALIDIEHGGELFTVRTLIDPGSQRTFVSEKIRNRLQLPTRNARFDIIGIGGQTQKASRECDIVIYSHRYNMRFSINAIVLPKLTKRLPAVSFSIPNPGDFEEIDLADPQFNTSAQIDLILGNDSERFINIEGIKKNISGTTSAYNTIFGWVLSGPVVAEQVQVFTTNVVASDDCQIGDILRKFWEQEEVPTFDSVSDEDKYCEAFYRETTTRRSDGRYVVRLPFRKEFPDAVFLGSSRYIALGQYARMEKNLIKDYDLQTQYNAVLNEYITLDHMEESSPSEVVTNGKFHSFYLPHHAVVRPEHKTTKVRVVFNASRKSKSGFSLNDILYTGPTLQTDLVGTILNWRRYKYVFSGDIQKMYRQILVHPTDRPFQRILHQADAKGPIKDYQLSTVTFGVNCAPFLAIRTLLQLASDIETSYPRASFMLKHETYVDDILSGGFSIEETRKAQLELISVLKSAGFPLKKLTANDTQLLDHLPPDDLYDSQFLRFHDTSSTKTLGIKWNALADTFMYHFAVTSSNIITKRQILSIVAQLFDPAGWITPIVIKAKMFMQQLWLEGATWDETLSHEPTATWKIIISELTQIDKIIVPRWIQYKPSDLVRIYGFADASKAAYCACVYVACQSSTFITHCNLLVAKSKVAPLNTVSLPRLELNGAVLLSKLVNYVIATMKFNVVDTILWTDSSIVLGWLSKPPCSWETYVANRTAQIHSLVPHATWRHVLTHDNPADIGTRGCRPQDLANNTMWWNGPKWLTNPQSTWPKSNPIPTAEQSLNVQSFQITSEQTDILARFSSYTKALRVLSYVFRFFYRTHAEYKLNTSYSSISISQREISFVKTRLITLAQKIYYREEYKALISSQSISDKSPLRPLNPLLDDHKVLRVNGRLSDSSLPYNERFPIILPGNSRLSTLYLSHLHVFLVHAECNQMCRMVQTEFYISRLKPRIKSIIRKCKVCVIFKQRPCFQLMAPLPLDRCTLSPPFHVTGIDFAGPFELKSSTLRNSPIIKGYVCVFVCFATKAVHLEVCSDLSSEKFQATFARFVGRRGLPHRVLSDNGRNFVGASRVLFREFNTFLKSASSELADKYATHGFEWSFIPPHAPHMGGLWEAAVKSFKFHFKRTACSHKFTFEKIATVLARIEGVLNSRPISAVSENPEDLTALTPGHFLRGAPIMAMPELQPLNLSLTNRWVKLKALHHQFAIKWKEDYLKSLHKRYKWKNSMPNLKIDDLVVVMDDLLPPNEWRLGRIENVHQGSDSKVRAADVRVAGGIITRPIVKLCYLPYENDTIEP